MAAELYKRSHKDLNSEGKEDTHQAKQSLVDYFQRILVIAVFMCEEK